MFHDGRSTRAESVTRFDTGGFAVMCLAVSKYNESDQTATLAVGHNGECQLYKLQMTTDKRKLSKFI